MVCSAVPHFIGSEILTLHFTSRCGHCKRLAPTWEKLAEKFKGNYCIVNYILKTKQFANHNIIVDNDNVVIGHVDCTAGDNLNRALCDSNGVNGFPTLNIYKNGVKVTCNISIINASKNDLAYICYILRMQIDEYNGKRDLGELQDFVEKQLSAKDEKEAKDEL